MTDTTTTFEVQSTAKPAADLDGRIDGVGCAVRYLEIAIEDLETALDRLEGGDFPAAVRELAADMSRAAAQVRVEFECGYFDDQVTELEILAEAQGTD
jgi:hypothetical protein